jgi:hypothetical protein
VETQCEAKGRLILKIQDETYSNKTDRLSKISAMLFSRRDEKDAEA